MSHCKGLFGCVGHDVAINCVSVLLATGIDAADTGHDHVAVKAAAPGGRLSCQELASNDSLSAAVGAKAKQTHALTHLCL